MKRVILVSLIEGVDRYSDRQYPFLCEDQHSVKAGDYVVIVHNEILTVGRVYKSEGLAKYYKKNIRDWIVQRVNLEEYRNTLKREEKVLELKTRLECRRREIENFRVYETLANQDDIIKNLVEELIKIDPESKIKED